MSNPLTDIRETIKGHDFQKVPTVNAPRPTNPLQDTGYGGPARPDPMQGDPRKSPAPKPELDRETAAPTPYPKYDGFGHPSHGVGSISNPAKPFKLSQ